MKRFLLLAASIAWVPPADAGETVDIIRYTADPMPVFDDQMTPAGVMPASELPTPPTPAVKRDGVFYGVRLDSGQMVWLRLATVEVSDVKKVREIVCAEVELADPADLTEQVMRGLESGCEKK